MSTGDSWGTSLMFFVIPLGTPRNDGESSWIHGVNCHVEHQTKITVCFATCCWAPMIYKVFEWWVMPKNEWAWCGSTEKTTCVISLKQKCLMMCWFILHNTTYVFCNTSSNIEKTCFKLGYFFCSIVFPMKVTTGRLGRGSWPPGAENFESRSKEAAAADFDGAWWCLKVNSALKTK